MSQTKQTDKHAKRGLHSYKINPSPQLCLVLLCGDYFHSEITIKFIREVNFDVKTVLNLSNYRFDELENFHKHQISTNNTEIHVSLEEGLEAANLRLGVTS